MVAGGGEKGRSESGEVSRGGEPSGSDDEIFARKGNQDPAGGNGNGVD